MWALTTTLGRDALPRSRPTTFCRSGNMPIWVASMSLSVSQAKTRSDTGLFTARRAVDVAELEDELGQVIAVDVFENTLDVWARHDPVRSDSATSHSPIKRVVTAGLSQKGP